MTRKWRKAEKGKGLQSIEVETTKSCTEGSCVNVIVPTLNNQKFSFFLIFFSQCKLKLQESREERKTPKYSFVPNVKSTSHISISISSSNGVQVKASTACWKGGGISVRPTPRPSLLFDVEISCMCKRPQDFRESHRNRIWIEKWTQRGL